MAASSSTLDYPGMAWNYDHDRQFSTRSDLVSHSLSGVPSSSSSSPPELIKALNPSSASSSSVPLTTEQPTFTTQTKPLLTSSVSSSSPLVMPNLHALKQQLHQSILAMNRGALQSMPSPRLTFSASHLQPHAHSCTHQHPPLSPSCCSSSVSPRAPTPTPTYASPTFDHCASFLSMQAQRQALAAARISKLRNTSPLSPQESSTTVNFSDSNLQSPFSQASSIVEPFKPSSIPMQPEPFKPNSIPMQPEPSPLYAPSSFNIDSVSRRDVQSSEVPIVRGPCAFKSSPVSAPAKASTTHFGNNNSYHTIDNSKRLKCTLEDLERKLLGDEDIGVPTSSTVFDAELSPLTASSGPRDQDRDWTDIIEDLLCTESSSLPNTTVNQSTVTCTSSKKEEAMPLSVSLSPRDASAQLTELLLSCANALNENDLPMARSKIACLEQSVSTYGDPMQRLAAFMVHGLVARIEWLQSGYSRSSKLKEPTPPDIMKATQFLYRVCPYFHFGFLVANGVIVETFKNEAQIHIIDFKIREGNQWQALIRAFAQRPGGAPRLRITGVADPKFPTNLEGVGRRLHEIAKMAGVPFEFSALAMEVSKLEPWMLQRKPNEALAVNFAFQLHHMADESVNTSNHRDRILRMVRAMNPKVVTLVELEANTNTAPFYPRFVETLNFFGAVFESLDEHVARDNKERVNAELCLARHIVNITACEGAERVERYELAGKWCVRMSMAGFKPLPLSSFIMKTTKESFQHYSPNYKIREESGALFLDWLERGLVFGSAWY